MFDFIRRFLMKHDPLLRRPAVSENLHQPLTKTEFNEWIENLNPIELRVDDEGNPHPDDVESLRERIKRQVEEIKSQEAE